MASNANWMESAFKNAGKPGHSLHRATGTPAGETIPKKKVYKAEHSNSAHVRHMAQAAANANPGRRRYGQ